MLLPALLLLVASESNYLVVVPRDAAAGYQKAAESLAKAHAAQLERIGGDWAELGALLAAREPRALALVLPPSAIDANLPRRLLPLLASFDDDPFVDCAWGVITGADGRDAQRFVDNIARAAKKERPARSFSATSVVVDRCLRLGPTNETRGVERKLAHDELWITGKDPKWKEFVARERDVAEGRALIEWGHCGDSQGIWLFSMYRNAEHDKHWPFEPAKVGQDPTHEMPRLTPLDLVEDVELFPAVVVNGSCHSGVTFNTMVGGDIVSTFGDTGGVVRFFAIAPEQSFPLMAIRHGATGYIAPLAANNANRAALEMWWIERGGVTLGEVVKRTSDELVLADIDRKLEFALFVDGQREPEEVAMFDDCANRVLFGDPLSVVWKDVVPTAHKVAIEKFAGGLRIDVRWDPLQSDPWVWDPWRQERTSGEKGRIYERIALESFPPGKPLVTVLEAQAEYGKELRPLALTAFALVERDLDDKPVLHLKAQGARADMDPLANPGSGPSALHARFEVRYQTPKTGGR